MIDNNGFKICKKCNISKHVDFFYKLKALRPNDDSFDYYCKECRNLAVKKTFKTNKVKCSEQDCNKPNYARHLCRMHYDRSIRQERRKKK